VDDADPPLTDRLDACLALLEAIVEDRALLADIDGERRRRLVEAAGRLAHPDKSALRKMAKAFRRKERVEQKQADEELLGATQIRALRRASVFPTPLPMSAPPAQLAGGGVATFEAAPEPSVDGGRASRHEAGPELREARKCYVCKAAFRRVHFFYDQMCEACAELNWAKRNQTADLRGRVAIVTGSRVKIGYQAAILLLRAGAHVLVTTRFPRDAAARYAREADYEAFRDRLDVYGLDLRHTPSVEAFTKHVTTHYDRLDFILNNACQTVRRPAGFYAHLLEKERAPFDALPSEDKRLLERYEELRAASGDAMTRGALDDRSAAGLHDPAALSQLALTDEDREASRAIFPDGRLDQDLQQVDLRDRNSWRLALAEVPTVELLEVQLVNAVAPFVLNARLKPVMLRQKTFDKHIVNVSAMEGQFYRDFKTDKHPHTNMAKAALNMMTRTSAIDYAKDGIFMNSVDTGWVTDEDPAMVAARKVDEHGFHPPLDIVDGAARIVDPIFSGIRTGEHAWGKFFKDYAETPW
jgi:NAD(P)-dependent dehydrogenase (short-subunit alcohol dehydrogenase family)